MKVSITSLQKGDSFKSTEPYCYQKQIYTVTEIKNSCVETTNRNSTICFPNDVKVTKQN